MNADSAGLVGAVTAVGALAGVFLGNRNAQQMAKEDRRQRRLEDCYVAQIVIMRKICHSWNALVLDARPGPTPSFDLDNLDAHAVRARINIYASEKVIDLIEHWDELKDHVGEIDPTVDGGTLLAVAVEGLDRQRDTAEVAMRQEFTERLGWWGRWRRRRAN